MNTYLQQIRKEQDRCLMVNYFVTNVMYESLDSKDREEYISAIRRLYEPVMHIFSSPLSDDDFEYLADFPLSELFKSC